MFIHLDGSFDCDFTQPYIVIAKSIGEDTYFVHCHWVKTHYGNPVYKSLVVMFLNLNHVKV